MLIAKDDEQQSREITELDMPCANGDAPRHVATHHVCDGVRVPDAPFEERKHGVDHSPMRASFERHVEVRAECVGGFVEGIGARKGGHTP